jgi:hypothetical protein
MQAKIHIADGIDDDSLIGQTVYFEAKRLIKIGQTDHLAASRRKGGPGGNKPFYDLIPGTVIHVGPGRLGIEAAGGIYSRHMDDVVVEQDLNGWMFDHPGKWVMRGDQ